MKRGAFIATTAAAACLPLTPKPDERLLPFRIEDLETGAMLSAHASCSEAVVECVRQQRLGRRVAMLLPRGNLIFVGQEFLFEPVIRIGWHDD